MGEGVVIVERGRRNEVVVRYRDEDGERKSLTLNQAPTCYVRESDIGNLTPHFTVLAGEYKGLYGEVLRKVSFRTTEDMAQSVSNVETWEANIHHANKVLAESGHTFPMYEHRVWFFDMEWKIDNGEITIIVVQDSQEGEFVFFRHKDYEAGFYDEVHMRDHPYGETVCKSGERKFRCFATEKDMLEAFAKLMAKHDPDILTGWNVVNADCQQLFKRFKANNLDTRRLSPMRRVRYDFGDWAQPIVGVNVIDLMVGFKKLWTLKNGQLPAMSLDAVSEFCLGDRKVPLKDGHDTYYTDFGTYLDYARQDVDLLPRLNNLVDVLGYFTAIQHIANCDIRSTAFITQVFSNLCLMDKEFDLKMPSRPQFAKVDYQGADIMTPQAGLYKNVGIFDVRAMYHSNVSKYGICWTTLSDDGEDCGNGIRFDRSKKGLLCRQMDKMTDLRNHYKKLKAEAKTEEESRTYDALQYATKSLVASMYGVAGDAKYGLYHPDIAAAITYTSRKTLGELREIAEELGFPVRYGHTDSIMCEVPDPEQGLAALDTINKRMFPIITEFEKWSESFFILAKNRYCGLVSWTDGEYHEPERYVKGIEIKQSRLPAAMKTAMGQVIDGILQGESQEDITDSLRETIVNVVEKKVPIADLTIKAKLKDNLSKYRVLSEARAGAKWANDNLGKGYKKDDYFLCSLNERGEYIAFDDPSEIEGIAEIGYEHMARKYIYDKVLPYYEVMGWDYMPLENALRGLSGFWL
jgi:DNA polymerase-2